LHALTSLKNTFQWGGKKQKSFDTLKENISTTPVLELSNLQQPFEIETDASGYAMGVVLMQYRKPIYYHSETFNQDVFNYPTYDKKLYALVQSVKKWKHYLLGKETMIPIDHQTLQYLQAKNNMKQSQHYRWMGFLQKFRLVIKYKKGMSNKVVDMLSRPPIVAFIILKNDSLSHDIYVEQYVVDEYFKQVFEKLTHGSQLDNYFL
jgi:hypothetical protein